jgi:hypothetical protein
VFQLGSSFKVISSNAREKYNYKKLPIGKTIYLSKKYLSSGKYCFVIE